MDVRPEVLGWRDERISRRHREWGYHLPAIDLDFLLVEYDKGRAAALVEYKHEHAQHFRREHPSYRALVGLANAAGIPAFHCRYAEDFAWFCVTPLNDHAREFVEIDQIMLTESEWMRLLHRMRGGR